MPLGDQRGFTLIELLMAMAVFSFMLSIVVVGFLTVVNIHNEALASNQSQDSARAAMDTLVQAVRDSTNLPTITNAAAPGITNANFDVLCLQSPTGFEDYYVTGNPAQIVSGSVTNCGDTVPTNVTPVTSNAEKVSYFRAVQQTSSAQPNWRPEIELTLTLGSSNGTTNGTGTGLACNNNNADRVFCSTATLTSGAVPR